MSPFKESLIVFKLRSNEEVKANVQNWFIEKKTINMFAADKKKATRMIEKMYNSHNKLCIIE